MGYNINLLEGSAERDGLSDIFLLDLMGRGLTRLSNLKNFYTILGMM